MEELVSTYIVFKASKRRGGRVPWMGVVNNLIFKLGLLRKLAQAESPSYLKNVEILGKNGHKKSVLKKKKTKTIDSFYDFIIKPFP